MSYVYTPYGERTVLDGDFTPVAGGASLFGVDEGHQGLSADAETGLVYNRHRYLHVTLGRFTSPDPHPQGRYVDGMNGYEYVRSGPVGLQDPMGLQACSCNISNVQMQMHGIRVVVETKEEEYEVGVKTPEQSSLLDDLADASEDSLRRTEVPRARIGDEKMLPTNTALKVMVAKLRIELVFSVRYDSCGPGGKSVARTTLRQSYLLTEVTYDPANKMLTDPTDVGHLVRDFKSAYNDALRVGTDMSRRDAAGKSAWDNVARGAAEQHCAENCQ